MSRTSTHAVSHLPRDIRILRPLLFHSIYGFWLSSRRVRRDHYSKRPQLFYFISTRPGIVLFFFLCFHILIYASTDPWVASFGNPVSETVDDVLSSRQSFRYRDTYFLQCRVIATACISRMSSAIRVDWGIVIAKRHNEYLCRSICSRYFCRGSALTRVAVSISCGLFRRAVWRQLTEEIVEPRTAGGSNEIQTGEDVLIGDRSRGAKPGESFYAS